MSLGLFYSRSVARISRVPEIYYRIDIEELEPKNEEQKQYQSYLTSILYNKLNSLVVLGTVGNGKTMFACGMLNNYINDYPYKATYSTQDSILDDIHATYNGNGKTEQQVVEFYSRQPLLVIDELKPVNWTDTNKNVIQKILVARHANGLKTVLIGNLTPDQFKMMFDEHIRSRLREGKTILMTAPDMREESLI